MKVILYMGITPNGYIARADGNSEWTSQEDLAGFYEQSKRVGNIVMGANTFRAATQYGYFPFPEAVNVVLSRSPIENTWGENRVLITDQTPKEIIATMKQKGFETVFLAGGGMLNSSFAKDDLIDEIYFDVEPLVLGKGIKVFADEDFELGLELLEVKKLNEHTVQLHYQVIKS